MGYYFEKDLLKRIHKGRPCVALERLVVQGISAPEVVDDVGGWPPLRGVPAGLGQLAVLDHRAIVVAAFGDTQVQAYVDSLYSMPC
jgi:hypothetical protein